MIEEMEKIVVLQRTGILKIGNDGSFWMDAPTCIEGNERDIAIKALQAGYNSGDYVTYQVRIPIKRK
ncbi:MAG: hypothetical protein KKF68_01585 [Nanoarchaeota archaeon]|nr:hypothetical protein [Nanoarchaeota archaeon]